MPNAPDSAGDQRCFGVSQVFVQFRNQKSTPSNFFTQGACCTPDDPENTYQNEVYSYNKTIANIFKTKRLYQPANKILIIEFAPLKDPDNQVSNKRIQQRDQVTP